MSFFFSLLFIVPFQVSLRESLDPKTFYGWKYYVFLVTLSIIQASGYTIAVPLRGFLGDGLNQGGILMFMVATLVLAVN